MFAYLQVDLQTLQEFQEETEKSQKALMETIDALEIKTSKLEIENAALKEETKCTKCGTEVCSLMSLS